MAGTERMAPAMSTQSEGTEGKTVRLNIGQNFMDLCRKFKRINRRYDNAKLIYEAYSLNEVLNILKKKDKYRKVIQFITSKYKAIINYLF